MQRIGHAGIAMQVRWSGRVRNGFPGTAEGGRPAGSSGSEDPGAPDTEASSGEPGSPDRLSDLERLARLKDQGILSDDEFAAEKRRLRES